MVLMFWDRFQHMVLYVDDFFFSFLFIVLLLFPSLKKLESCFLFLFFFNYVRSDTVLSLHILKSLMNCPR